MKIVKKMLNGGGMPPFTYYKPVTLGKSTTATTENKTDSDDITQKDIISLMKDILALPTDSNTISTLASEMLTNSIFGTDDFSSNLANKYLQIVNKLNNAKFGYELFKDAKENVINNKGLETIAVDSQGLLYGKNINSGDITPLTVQQYKDNKQQYILLTNADLLRERATNPKFAFNNRILDVVNNGIGLEKITELIKSTVSNIGATNITNSGYNQAESKMISEGLKQLQIAHDNAVSNDLNITSVKGLYLGKFITKNSAKEALMAIDYIYQTLPTNAKIILSMYTDSDPRDLISKYILSSVDTTYSLSSETPSKSSTGTSNGVNLPDIKMNAALMWYLGMGAKKQEILNPGSKYAINALTTIMRVSKKDGTPLGRSSIQELLESSFAGMMDDTNISLNGEIISSAGWDKVLTDGIAHNIDLPINLEIYNQSGKIVPELALSKKLELLDELIKQKNLDEKSDFKEINKLCEQLNIPIKYTDSGELRQSEWHRFAAFNSVALNTAFKTDASFSNFLSEVIDDNEIDNYVQIFQQRFGEKNFKFDKADWWDKALGRPLNLFSTNDLIFRGTVYIPVIDSAFSAIASSGIEYEANEVLNIDIAEQNKLKLQTYLNAGGDLYGE